MTGFSIFLYGFVVIGKTLLTKLCFSAYSFDYPITFSLFSCLTTMLGCMGIIAAGISEWAWLPKHHWKIFGSVAVLTASDMGFTNWSLDLISVALQLTIKAAIPAIVVGYEVVMLRRAHSSIVYLSIIPLVLGAVLVGLGSGSADFNMLGAILMVIATFASAIKMVTTHSAIRQVRKDLKGMVVFLFWLEAAMIPILLPWCWLNGELSTLNQWSEYGEFGAWAFILIVAVIGGFRAYVQNLVLRYNSALTLAAANILIQALTIIISIWLFNTSTTIELDLGIIVSMLGYAMYTMQKTLAKAGDDKKKTTSKPAGEKDVESGKSKQEETPLLNGASQVSK